MRDCPYLSLAGLLQCSGSIAQTGPVIQTGAMRNTMFNGQLAGLILLDSIAEPSTYGIGPLAHLRGEVLLLDGIVFVSAVEKEQGIHVGNGPMCACPSSCINMLRSGPRSHYRTVWLTCPRSMPFTLHGSHPPTSPSCSASAVRSRWMPTAWTYRWTMR